jgi:hypothetical protein
MEIRDVLNSIGHTCRSVRPISPSVMFGPVSRLVTGAPQAASNRFFPVPSGFLRLEI